MFIGRLAIQVGMGGVGSYTQSTIELISDAISISYKNPVALSIIESNFSHETDIYLAMHHEKL